jgi:hypothetical protein
MNSGSSSNATKPGRLEREQVAQLESQLRGSLIHPDDDTYTGTRVVWNRMIDRRPALIARCAGGPPT